ncbi:hypothetical protein GCM10028773_25310 [Spirosoma koreense]
MNHSSNSFNKLLEHYLFSIASQHICFLDTQTQVQIIDMINQLDIEADTEIDDTLVDQGPLAQWEIEIKQLLKQSTMALLILASL